MNKAPSSSPKSLRSILNNISGSGPHRGISVVKKQVDEIQSQSELLDRLDTLSISRGTREIQSLAYKAVREDIAAGNRSGIFKISTGVGKTRIFANLLVVLKKNWLTLVPRVDLYKSTAREFREVGFRDHEIKFLHEEEWLNTVEKMVSLLTDPSINWSSGRIQCIMTYQALTTLVRKDIQIGGFIRSHFDVIIEDEAHRWLWDMTQNATEALKDDLDDGVSLVDPVWEGIVEAEEILQIEWDTISGGRYNYKFTATPDLLGKSVAKNGEYLFYSTIEKSVRTGAIILPQYLDMGSAYTKNTELENWKVADIESLAEGDNFIDESGVSIRFKIIQRYLTKKHEHWVLPAVAFTSTIKHAEQIVKSMREQWIRAERVTSASSDISSHEAVRRMDRGELDVIVTVTKVSEGFDYPPLACALWFAPVLSPAKILQGNGRIMRYTDHKKPDTILDESGKISLSPNSYIIAPSIWYGGSYTPKDWNWQNISLDRNDEPEGRLSNTSPRIGNFYELLVSQGEIDSQFLAFSIQSILTQDMIYQCNVGEDVLIDGIIYIGVSEKYEINWISGATIFKRAKERGVSITSGVQKSWHSIRLIPKDFIDSLLERYEVWEETLVDGVVYICLTKAFVFHWLNGQTILTHANEKAVNILMRRQKNGRQIRLVPKDFIDSLLERYEVWEETLVDGVAYIGVVNNSNKLPLSGQSIISYAEEHNIKILVRRQKNGSQIRLIPKDFIDSLLERYEVWEEIIIDNITYIGVSEDSKIKWLRGTSIFKEVKNRNIPLLLKQQKSWHSIRLVPKDFIDSLLKTYEVWEEVLIDEVVYIGVITNSIVFWLRGRTIIDSARRSSVRLLSWIQSNRMFVRLIPKDFIEWLVRSSQK